MWTDGWAAFDSETTGLGSDARIVELAVVTFDRGSDGVLRAVREWSQMLCPGDIDWESKDVKKALEVNRLTRAELVDKPLFSDVLADFLVELSHPVWVAHNADFDVRMVNQELQRLRRPDLSPQLLVCTKNLAAHMRLSARNRLSDVAGYFKVQQEDAHRATVDAAVCGKVLAAMLAAGKLPAEDLAMHQLCAQASASWRGNHRW